MARLNREVPDRVSPDYARSDDVPERAYPEGERDSDDGDADRRHGLGTDASSRTGPSSPRSAGPGSGAETGHPPGWAVKLTSSSAVNTV